VDLGTALPETYTLEIRYHRCIKYQNIDAGRISGVLGQDSYTGEHIAPVTIGGHRSKRFLHVFSLYQCTRLLIAGFYTFQIPNVIRVITRVFVLYKGFVRDA